ncbi:MAG: toprim domain-containing protein [Armatimonadetes bacterium]|nr:toprim domain-containing protein [Armatimonadota bacterium]
MTQANPITLLDRAMAQAPSGRNNAGFWLAQQLHWNGYSEPDAEAVILRFADATGLPHKEVRAILKAEYRRSAKEPWAGSDNGGVKTDQRAAKLARAFPTAPPVKRDPEPDPDSVVRFKRAVRQVKPLASTSAEAYLASRGIPSDVAKSALCKYAPEWVGIGEAVVFPIRNEEGKTIAANGRSLHTKANRTLGPMKLGVFYTSGALEADPIAIVEAPIDALTLALAGLPAIALCGTSSPAMWIVKRLATPAANTPAGHSRTVYLATDNDTAGEQAAARISTGLSLIRTIRLRPFYKDWNEDLTTSGLDSLRERLTQAGVRLQSNNDLEACAEASESHHRRIKRTPVADTY